MYFEIIGEIIHPETIAVGKSIRDIARLRKQYGQARWRKPMKQRKNGTRFVICVKNEGCDDLESGKVYRVLLDKRGAEVNFLRVIDESGEDYLYRANLFVSVTLPLKVRRALTETRGPSLPRRQVQVRARGLATLRKRKRIIA